MTFNDIFKSSFLENFAAVTVADLVIALALALGLDLFYLIFKKPYTQILNRPLRIQL